jgi:hypothetical protein
MREAQGGMKIFNQRPLFGRPLRQRVEKEFFALNDTSA